MIQAYIDHTNLKPDATLQAIQKLCKEAVDMNMYSVCIHPMWVSQAKELLQDTKVKVCTVVGFPLGAMTTATKVYETEQAILDGVDEIDMVIPIGALKQGDTQRVYDDIACVVKASRGRLVKVIIETCLLTDDEKVLACQLAEKAGAAYVKTSTGFNGGGATVADIRLMRKTVSDAMGVKASGGIRHYKDAKAMLEAGATRIGASASVAIINESTQE